MSEMLDAQGTKLEMSNGDGECNYRDDRNGRESTLFNQQFSRADKRNSWGVVGFLLETMLPI